MSPPTTNRGLVPPLLRGESLGDFAPSLNLSRHLTERAAEFPDRCAVRSFDGRTLTFEALETRCDAIARGLAELGLARGDRACLFVRPGAELIAITHALFRSGIVPVLIDPGMGRKNLLACVERIAPRAFIGIPKAHLARVLFPRSFRSIEIAVTVGRRLGWNGVTLADIEGVGGSEWRPVDTAADDEAAIVFTSGSTGPPKGVSTTFGMFEGQLRALARLYGLGPGGVNVACFPLFALFDNALGMTSVFPDLDASRPGTCDPARVYAALEESGATFTFGSPAIWRRVLPWMEARGKRLSTLRSLTIAGAPVPPRLVLGLRARLPKGGDVFTPYGATEALPVSDISGAALAAGLAARTEAGEGSCVGAAAPGIELGLIRITDEAIEAWDEGLLVAPGERGEIVVRGPVVTRTYRRDEAATRLAKIRDGGTIWHRMGDVGRLDEEGRLWFLGRKSHRLETRDGLLMPVPIENVFNTCPGVHRTALVGVGPRGAQRPVLVVEREKGASRRRVGAGLAAKEREHSALAGVLFHPRFPVDVRHNAKIKRGELARWAEGRAK